MKKVSQKRTKTNTLVEFNVKQGYDTQKIKKCWKYYYKITKHNSALALHYTYKYIDYCYNDMKYTPKLNDETKYKRENYLLNRFGEINKKYKYSYSILLSVVPSYIISLLFVILQIPDENKITYWGIISNAFNDLQVFMAGNPIIILIILTPLLLIDFAILSFIPFSILIVTYIIVDLLYYSPYRNMVVPYERRIILDTLRTFDERYKHLD